MTLSLREMIDQSLALGQHRVKQAQDGNVSTKKVKTASPVASSTGNYTPTAEILKLAEACDYITYKVAGGPGPGIGPGAMPLESHRKGDFPVDMGGAQTKKMPQKGGKEPGSVPGSNQKNVMKSNYTEQPGAGESMDVHQAAKTKRVSNIIKKVKAKDTPVGPSGSALETNYESTHEESVPDYAKVIQDAQKIIDSKKRELTAPEKKDLKKVINETPHSKKTDPVLHDALEGVDEAGAKISSVATEAARVLLKKLASQGCSCGGRHVCGFCKLSAVVGSDTMWKQGEEDEEEDEEEDDDPPSAASSIQH